MLDEFVDMGYGRLSMETVAKRAGVGKSALYRRWRSKHEMISAVVSEFGVSRAPEPDTGTLRGDLRESVQAGYDWLTHPRFARILPDLIAEGARDPEPAEDMRSSIGGPRRELARPLFERAVKRGELPADTDVELGLDLLAAPIYGRLVVRREPPDPQFLDGSSSTCSARSTPAPGTDYARSGSPATRSMRAPRRLRFSTKCG